MTDDVRFNVDGFLRPDTTTRYAAHKTAIEAGFLTIDEVRAIEGLNPLEKEQETERKGGDSDDTGPAEAPGDDHASDRETDQVDRDSGDDTARDRG